MRDAGVVLAFGLSLPLDPIPQFGNRPEKIVISDVKVVDVARGIAIPNQTLSIAKGRISSITGDAKLVNDSDAMVINGRGVRRIAQPCACL